MATAWRWNSSNAIAVAHSKNVGGAESAPSTDERFSGVLHGRCRVPQVARRHFALVDDEPFFEPLEVWGGVARRRGAPRRGAPPRSSR